MSDIFERLCYPHTVDNGDGTCRYVIDPLRKEAADTIDQLRRERDDATSMWTETCARLHEVKDKLTAANAEIARLTSALKQKIEDGCDKIMAMSDDQIAALCRLQGHDPQDEAQLAKQAAKIAILKHKLAAATRRAEETEKVIEKCYAALSEESAAYEEPLAHVEEALAAIDDWRKTK